VFLDKRFSQHSGKNVKAKAIENGVLDRAPFAFYEYGFFR
jgi:hypothetical protein